MSEKRKKERIDYKILNNTGERKAKVERRDSITELSQLLESVKISKMENELFHKFEIIISTFHDFLDEQGLEETNYYSANDIETFVKRIESYRLELRNFTCELKSNYSEENFRRDFSDKIDETLKLMKEQIKFAKNLEKQENQKLDVKPETNAVVLPKVDFAVFKFSIDEAERLLTEIIQELTFNSKISDEELYALHQKQEQQKTRCDLIGKKVQEVLQKTPVDYPD